MSFSKGAAEQELTRGSDTEGFCAPVAFLNPTQGVQGHFGSHATAKHRYVLEFMFYKNHIALTASKQNETWDRRKKNNLHFYAGTWCNSDSDREQQVYVCS